MASKASASTALLLALSLLLSSSLASAAYCPPPPYKKPHYHSVPARPACPRDALKLGVCADVLGLINLNLGSPPKTPCCTLLDGLADLEAAVCLCTAIHANVLGIELNVLVDLSLILNYCGKKVPSGFKC